MELLFTYPGQIITHQSDPSRKLISLSSDLRVPVPCRWITFNNDTVEINDIFFNSDELSAWNTGMYSTCMARPGDKVHHKTHNSILFEVRSVNLDTQTMDCDLIIGTRGGLYTFSRYEMQEYPEIEYPDFLRDPL